MIRRDLQRHRFSTNSDYNISSTIIVGGVETRITTHIPSEYINGTEDRINDLMDIERELSLHFSNDILVEDIIEDTMEQDLLSIRSNMAETMGFSNITFPITFREHGIQEEDEYVFTGNGGILYDNGDFVSGEGLRMSLRNETHPLNDILKNNSFTIMVEPSFIKKHIKKHRLCDIGIPESLRYDNNMDYYGSWFDENWG